MVGLVKMLTTEFYIQKRACRPPTEYSDMQVLLKNVNKNIKYKSLMHTKPENLNFQSGYSFEFTVSSMKENPGEFMYVYILVIFHILHSISFC